MNKKALIVVGVIFGLVVMSTLYLVFTPEKAVTPTYSNEAMPVRETTPEPSEDENTPVTPSVAATYVDYSAASFAEDTGTKVLFFHASWCPQCRMLDDDIQTGLDTLSDVTIYKVNYDTETDLRKKYNVTQQTTFVKTDSAGEQVDSFVAYDTPSLASVRKNLSL